MPVRDNIKEELEALRQLYPLLLAQEEITVMRMQRRRKVIVSAREFHNDVASLVADIRHAWWHKETIDKSGKRNAVVLLSSEERLAGEITASVITKFTDTISRDKADAFVVSRTNERYFSHKLGLQKFGFQQISDEKMTMAEVAPLIEKLLKYRRITFVHGVFESLISQRPEATVLGPEQSKTKAQPKNYIFEPSLTELKDFFDYNLIAVLLYQVFNESWLANASARISLLERAVIRTEEKMKKLEIKIRSQERRRESRKQFEKLAGQMLWSQ